MNVRYMKSYNGEKHPIAFCLMVLVAVFVVSNHSCQAQQPSLDAVLSDPLKQVGWVSGPEKVSLGDFADFDIPAGYRLTDAHGARVILQSYNTPVTDGVVGLLASSSGKWWAVIEYTPAGYVKNAGDQLIDTASVLKAAQAEIQKRDNAQGASAATSLSWKSKPVYDASTHSLAWSIQIQSPSMKGENDTVALLGRHGVLDITAVQASATADSSSLKQLIGDIKFRDGERYTDYQGGDKVADIGLAQLIVGQDHAAAAGSGFAASWIYWVYSGVGACIVVGIAGLLLMKKRSRPARVAVPVAAASVPATKPIVSASMVSAPTAAISPQVAPATAPSPTVASTMAAASSHHAASNHQNGAAAVKTNGAQAKTPKQFHRNRKKKVFNYPKFYTNVMRELSLHSYGPGTVANGKSGFNGHSNGHQNGHANGHTNGNTNGHSNGQSNGHTNGVNGINDAVKTEIGQLIASQKNLIEEQKCLLEQQTKLIAEKRWLIEEQTAFLKGQVNSQFPLKFE